MAPQLSQLGASLWNNANCSLREATEMPSSSRCNVICRPFPWAWPLEGEATTAPLPLTGELPADSADADFASAEPTADAFSVEDDLSAGPAFSAGPFDFSPPPFSPNPFGLSPLG